MAPAPTAPTDSEHYLILWTASLHENEDKRNNEQNAMHWTKEGKKTFCAAEGNNTNSKQLDPESAPAPQHKQNGTN